MTLKELIAKLRLMEESGLDLTKIQVLYYDTYQDLLLPINRVTVATSDGSVVLHS